MNLTITIPDSYKLYFNNKDIEKEIKENNALMLYKQEKISIEKASELAEINIYDFMLECKINQIPVIDYTEEEIIEEFEKIRERNK